jgi:hypothetical protein
MHRPPSKLSKNAPVGGPPIRVVPTGLEDGNARAGATFRAAFEGRGRPRPSNANRFE